MTTFTPPCGLDTRHSSTAQCLRHSVKLTNIFEGPLRLAASFSDFVATSANGHSVIQGAPNFLWPQDCAWIFGSAIDLPSTYIGGSRLLISGILNCEQLESFPAVLTDLVSTDSDSINR